MSFQGKKNIYLCSGCGHGFVSLDLDAGTTPFTTKCRHPGCKGLAQSMFYGAPQQALQDIAPAIIWYRPEAAELAGLSRGIQEHVRQGGLIARDQVPS